VVLLAAVLLGAFQWLQDPKNAFTAVKNVAALGRIPEDVFSDVEVKDETVWFDILTKGNLGMAEGYMHGKIKVDPLKLFVKVLNGTSIGTRRKEGVDVLGAVMTVVAAPTDIAARLFNQQSRDRSTRVTKKHYDAGNDLYEAMLGPTMSYTCAYWKDATTLEQAQTNKFDLIMRKLELEPGMKVADLGMGWGTAAAYMHEHGNVDVTGVSLSEEQVKWASGNLAKPGLRFVFADYREHCDDPAVAGTYDRVYSIGMLEHVGYLNYATFFSCVKRLLKPDGLAVVHAIGEPDFLVASDPFLDTYIFPGAVIPSISSVATELERNFILEDFQNFGFDYSLTLAEWDRRSKKYFKDNPTAYTIEFQRMWEYYLKMCEALFALRINQLYHFVLSPRPAYRTGIKRQL